jgi:multisubunit Na+/H+ antiporter MnhG subunit
VVVIVQEIVIGALLVCAGIAALISLAGVALMPGTHNRLHYLAPVSTIGAAAISAGVVLEEALDARGIKALLVLAVIAGLNPLLVHATARAARIRASGDWRLDRPTSKSSRG